MKDLELIANTASNPTRNSSSSGGVVVAERVAEQTAAFVDVVREIRGVVLKGVGVGEVDDGGFFQPLKAGFVLNHNRRGGAATACKN